MKKKFNFDECTRNTKKAIIQLNNFLKHENSLSDPMGVRDLLEVLQEVMCDFGQLKHGLFKFTQISMKFGEDERRKLSTYVNLFIKSDSLVLCYSTHEVGVIMEHSGELNYDDLYYDKMEILKEKRNIESILSFLETFYKDISDYWEKSEDYRRLQSAKSSRVKKSLKKNSDMLSFQSRHLTFDQETGDVHYKKKYIGSLTRDNRPYNFFRALYNNFGEYLSYEDLKILMGTGNPKSVDVVYFGDIYNKEVPKEIKAFIKKEKGGYRLVDVPLKIEKRNP